MSNFDNPNQTFNVKERTTIKVVFNVITDKTISSISGTCGCYNTMWDSKNITVSYNVGTVPTHLRHREVSEFSKGITVTFNDGTEERVTFGGKVKM